MTSDWDISAVTAGNTLEKDLVFILGWKNPFSTSPPYDGFYAQMTATITDAAASNSPDITIGWKTGTGVVYDTKPTAADEKPPVIDVELASVADGVFDNIAPLTAELSTDLCKEKWTYSDTSVSCVLIEGNLLRKFITPDPHNTASNTGATKQDLDLDYTTY